MQIGVYFNPAIAYSEGAQKIAEAFDRATNLEKREADDTRIVDRLIVHRDRNMRQYVALAGILDVQNLPAVRDLWITEYVIQEQGYNEHPPFGTYHLGRIVGEVYWANENAKRWVLIVRASGAEKYLYVARLYRAIMRGKIQPTEPAALSD